MGRARSPRRDEALRQFIKSNGQMMPKEIAELLNVPSDRIRKWKLEDKWDEVLAMPAEMRNIPKKKGPPYGSKNALGNKGGRGGPFGNQNAKGHGCKKGNTNGQITGEYTKICLATLTPEEKDIFFGIDEDPLKIISDNIRLLMIRERRMLINLEDLKKQKEVVEIDEHMVLKKGDDVKNPSIKEMTKRRRLLIDKIIACEDAITRVQEQLMRTIERQQKLINDMQEKATAVTNNITFSFER